MGRGMCIQLLLVSELSLATLAFVSPFPSSREFSGLTPQGGRLSSGN